MLLNKSCPFFSTCIFQSILDVVKVRCDSDAHSFCVCVCGHSNVFSVARVSSQSIHKPSHCLCVDLKNYTCKHLTAFFVDSFDRLFGVFISFIQLKALVSFSPFFSLLFSRLSLLASSISPFLPRFSYLASSISPFLSLSSLSFSPHLNAFALHLTP